jgi:hypothetical protein
MTGEQTAWMILGTTTWAPHQVSASPAPSQPTGRLPDAGWMRSIAALGGIVTPRRIEAKGGLTEALEQHYPDVR